MDKKDFQANVMYLGSQSLDTTDPEMIWANGIRFMLLFVTLFDEE